MGSIIQTDQIVANISQQFPVDIAALSFLFNRRFLDAMEDVISSRLQGGENTYSLLKSLESVTALVLKINCEGVFSTFHCLGQLNNSITVFL